MSQPPSQPRDLRPLSSQFIQHGLLGLMVTGQVAGLIFVFQLVAPGFPTLTITVLVFMVCLEAMATTRWLAHRERLLVDDTLYRCAELVTVVVATRLVVWVAQDELPDLERFIEYIDDPTLMFFDRDFFLSLAVVACAWFRACHFGGVFRELGVSEEEAELYALYRANPLDFPAGPPLDRNRSVIARDFQRSWAWGGVFLVACAAVATFDLSEIGTGEPVATGYVSVALLIYFVTGLWLASAARHSALNAKWMLTGTSKHGRVVSGWRRATGWLLAGVAAGASFLPAGTILPVAEALHFLVNGVLVLANFVLLVFARLLVALANLFSTDTEQEIDEKDLPGSLLPNVPDATEFTPPPALISPPDLGPLLWMLLMALVAVAFAYFVHERSKSWPNDLRKLLDNLWGWLMGRHKSDPRRRRGAVHDSEEPGARGLAPAKKSRRVRRFLLGLDAAAQIRELYRRLIEEAAKRHAHRRPSQTPSEYQRVLASRWPDQSSQITQMTEGFLKARYTRSDIPRSEAGAIKQIYRRLRTSIRKS